LPSPTHARDRRRVKLSLSVARVCSCEEAEVEFEHDQRELRYRIALLGETCPAVCWPSRAMSHEPKPLPADDRVRARFGKYQIDALIGVGGMGSVYRAAAADGTTVALKIVKQDLARDETLRRRVRREADRSDRQ
jgi:serine/threonine protein kinase